MLNNPTISFIVPIYNSGHLLSDCFKSIKKQRYPKNKIEIISPDGGSKDNGPQIARSFGAKVVKNRKILAEPGFMLGASIASGEFIVYMGADNRLAEINWIENMLKPFEDPKIIAAFPWHRSKKNSTWLTKYFNAFTDPVNHFVLGSACNPLYFKRAYGVLKKNQNYIVYDFSLQNFPMLAFDQGFTVRKAYQRPSDTEYDDILPVLDIIKRKMQIAFVPSCSNFHLTLEKGIFQFVKKMRWIIDNNISGNPKFGFPTRKSYLSLERKIRLYIWPVYTISLIGPIIYSLFGLIEYKKKEWFYHLPISLIMVFLVFFEIIRLKIFRGKSLVSRQ